MRTGLLSLFALGASLALFTPAYSQANGQPFPCQLPTDAAQSWTATFPHDETGTDDCPALCTKWVATCQAVAGGAASCLRVGFTQAVALEKAECQTLPTPEERQSCVAQWNNELRGAKQFLRLDLTQAKDDCESQESDCLSNCSPAP